jgi:glucokinase
LGRRTPPAQPVYPERVITADLFLNTIRDTVRRHCGYALRKNAIELASLGPEANLIGAARVWHHRFAQHGAHAV